MYSSIFVFLVIALSGLGVIAALVAIAFVSKQSGSSQMAAAGGGSIGLQLIVNKSTAQRERKKVEKKVLDVAAESGAIGARQLDAHNSLARKLRDARCPLSPLFFRMIQLIVTLAVFIPTYLYCTIFLQFAALVLTPMLVMDALQYFVNRRFKAFDRDYPSMLMQLVSFVKGGMMAMPALERAGKALDENSLVRNEVEVLIERLKLGMSEEQAISAFGEDIDHSEIELFVQSLLLHCKLGGKITPTLERLARQVRKRQQFRNEAVAVVAMEKLSIYAISGIMLAVLIYMMIKSPVLILSAFSTNTGILVFQGGVAAILFGVYLSNKVTKIRV